MRKTTLTVLCCAVLAACGAPPALPPEVEPIGDFRMGYNIVVANDVQRAPASREATEDELSTAVREAMEERLGRYDGDGLYHIGMRIEAYSLGRAGIPILFSPRSVLLIALNVWDDATQEKLTEEPVRITAFEGGGGPLVGSGLVKTREAQLRSLAFDAALEVEEYLAEREDEWFRPRADRTRTPFVRDPATGRAMSEEAAAAALQDAPEPPPAPVN